MPGNAGSYTLELHKNSDDLCAGELMHVFGPIAGKGKLNVDDLGEFKLASEDSIIGAHVRLVNGENNQLSCCEIKEHRQFWREKRAQDAAQIVQ